MTREYLDLYKYYRTSKAIAAKGVPPYYCDSWLRIGIMARDGLISYQAYVMIYNNIRNAYYYAKGWEK